MKIQAHVEKEDKTESVELDDRMLVKDALERLGINPVTVIVARDNEIILEDEVLHDGDELKIISVISGG